MGLILSGVAELVFFGYALAAMLMTLATEYVDILLAAFGQMASEHSEQMMEATRAQQEASGVVQTPIPGEKVEALTSVGAALVPQGLSELNSAVGGLEFALAVVVSLTALAAWINDRFFRVPAAIVALVSGAVYALVTLLLVKTGVVDSNYLKNLLETYQFQDLVLHGLLGFILFAAALQVDLGKLRSAAWGIAYLSTLGVVIFILLFGTMIWCVITGMNYVWPGEIKPFVWIGCIVMAAIIAPTDAAAVISIMRRVKAPEKLRLTVAGESLFNDAVSIVLFLVAAQLYLSTESVHAGDIALQLTRELVGGFVLGGVLALIGLGMLRSTINSSTRVLITLGIVLAGTCAAIVLKTSGPLAMVVAGILIGEFAKGGTPKSRHTTASFWDVIDQALNGILFMLLGLELLQLTWKPAVIIASFVVFWFILVARYLSLWLPGLLVGPENRFSQGQLILLTWCGLRGGVSVALALALGSEAVIAGMMDGEMREKFDTHIHPSIILSAFILVTMSMLLQGLTAPMVVRWVARREEKAD